MKKIIFGVLATLLMANVAMADTLDENLVKPDQEQVKAFVTTIQVMAIYYVVGNECKIKTNTNDYDGIIQRISDDVNVFDHKMPQLEVKAGFVTMVGAIYKKAEDDLNSNTDHLQDFKESCAKSDMKTSIEKFLDIVDKYISLLN